ncbi:uncharacterized protein LOC124925584 [Impatiens glandulifera]|uniref:uncharacterized protein LOC124925584 n=1 Tax=Impatiens glandulifera TaxID=253017 RepID=UPI001FB1661B|nr:uncharacterized protein LOC124925584 [Impatiens glandulifera]
MLCSVPAGKSSSKWLDRLRSAKGFPVGNELDLEQFLARRVDEPSKSSDIKPSSDASIASKLNSNTGTEETRRGDGEWMGLITNVLSEFFYMGDPVNFSRIGGKKGSRKQQNPKFCVVSAPLNVQNANFYNRRDALASPLIPSSGGDNSCTEAKEELRAPSKMAKAKKPAATCLADDVEDDKHQFNPSGFSRTDVTVIDTSIPSWKFEKLLFKRKNVWKVRDKKGKSASVIGKKREAKSSDEPHHVSEKKLKLCSSPKVHHPGTSKVDKDYGETSPACQGSKKRLVGKAKEGGSSSVVLIKEIPPCNRKGQTSSIRVV